MTGLKKFMELVHRAEVHSSLGRCQDLGNSLHRTHLIIPYIIRMWEIISYISDGQQAQVFTRKRFMKSFCIRRLALSLLRSTRIKLQKMS